MRFGAYYYDGKVSKPHKIIVIINEDILTFKLNNKINKFFLSQIHVEDRPRNNKKVIRLDNFSFIEIDSDINIDKLNKGKLSFSFFLHHIENKFHLVLLSVVFVIFFSWSFIQIIIPALASYASNSIPNEVAAKLASKLTLEVNLDEFLFHKSELSAQRQDEIKESISKLCSENVKCPPYSIIYRNSEELGANAFALPDGKIIITDQLVYISDNNYELSAIAAHELGHIYHKHWLKGLLQTSFVGIAAVLISGSFDSILSIAPVAMLNLKYSRSMEEEADNYALKILSTSHIKPSFFSDILTRIETNNKFSKKYSILSTHPGTPSRIKIFNNSDKVSM